jgi:hypothetical protein
MTNFSLALRHISSSQVPARFCPVANRVPVLEQLFLFQKRVSGTAFAAALAMDA